MEPQVRYLDDENQEQVGIVRERNGNLILVEHEDGSLDYICDFQRF